MKPLKSISHALSLLLILYFFASWTSHNPAAPLTSWSNLHCPVSSPCFNFFFCRLLHNHLIYLSELLFCIKEQQIKSEKPFELPLCLQILVAQVRSLPFAWSACDTAVGHSTITHCFSHRILPRPLLRMWLFQLHYLLPKSDISHSTPKLSILLPFCWPCFHSCPLPHWPPVTISVSFISLQPQPPCIHCRGHLGHPCHLEPPSSSTSHSPEKFQTPCPWVLCFLFCASHHCVAPAVGAAHPSPG